METLITPAMTNVSIACRTMAGMWCSTELIPELEARWGAMTPKLELILT
jgi:hypothetical protein